MQRVGDLDISQDLVFQRREWVAQKIGFALIALIVIGALLGFFGAGPLSLTTIEDDSGLMTVTYERFGRRGATSELQVEVAGSAASQGEIELRVAADYLDGLQIDSIVPTPDKVTAAGDYYVYTSLQNPIPIHSGRPSRTRSPQWDPRREASLSRTTRPWTSTTSSRHNP